MTYLVQFVVCFIAGIGAGLGTGFAGMSAAAVISPMLITFLGMDPYLAVGIALASDVLASAVSAYTYKKNGNLDVKNGAVMMAAVLVFTMVGSFVVIRKGNRELAAALAVIQREFAAANAEQVFKPRPPACVDRDLMTVQIQFLVAYYIDRNIFNVHRVIDVFHQLEIS